MRGASSQISAGWRPNLSFHILRSGSSDHQYPFSSRNLSLTIGRVDCPNCKNRGAYRGLLWIHCQNEGCEFFDARYTRKIQLENSKAFNDAVDGLILLQGEIGVDED